MPAALVFIMMMGLITMDITLIQGQILVQGQALEVQDLVRDLVLVREGQELLINQL